MEDLLKEWGEPDYPMPAAPAWHVKSNACPHGWIICGAEPKWGVCDCEDPAHPWPARLPGDGPRDCQCYGCKDRVPRSERGKFDQCEYKDHHCDTCHDERRCTSAACGSGPAA